MEQFNQTETELRLGNIYARLCQNPELITREEQSGPIIYELLGCEHIVRNYNKRNLTQLQGQTYTTNGRRYIPDGYTSQAHDTAVWKGINDHYRETHPDTESDEADLNTLWQEHDRRIATLNPDDKYSEGDYFFKTIDPAIQSDERIIINMATQQECLQLATELVSMSPGNICSVKFYAIQAAIPTAIPFKCDKLVIYYNKGIQNTDRNRIIAAIENIILRLELTRINSLGAFCHKTAHGIGYAYEPGNGTSFTEQICIWLLDTLLYRNQILPDIQFNGAEADKNKFVHKTFLQITRLINEESAYEEEDN